MSDFKVSTLVKLAALPASAVAGSSPHFGLFFLFDGVWGCRAQQATQLHNGNQGIRLRSQFLWPSAGAGWDWMAEPWPTLLETHGSPAAWASPSTAELQRPFPQPHHDCLPANCCYKEIHPVYPIIVLYSSFLYGKCQPSDWWDWSISWVCVCTCLHA